MKKDLMQRIKARISVQQDSNCWEWQGAETVERYGKIFYRGRLHLTHRLMYKLTFKPDKEPEVVMHLCNNPTCCNPEHLQAGTTRENMIHAVACDKHKGGGNPNTTGLKGVSIRKNRGKFTARANLGGVRIHLYEGKDFFEACCARKSWELSQSRGGLIEKES